METPTHVASDPAGNPHAATGWTPPPPPAGRIEGVAQYRTPEGRIASCANLSVALLVETPRTRDRMLALYGSTEHAVEPVSVVKARSAGLEAGAQPVSTAGCDARGAFSFAEVEAGAYYMIAHLRVTPAGKSPTDLVLLERVAVRPGEARQVRLAP